MIIKLSDYILENKISDLDLSDELYFEQCVAEAEVATKLSNAYAKESAILCYLEADGGTEGFFAKAGRVIGDFFKKVWEGLKKAFRAVIDFFIGIFNKIKEFFKGKKVDPTTVKEELQNKSEEEKRDFKIEIDMSKLVDMQRNYSNDPNMWVAYLKYTVDISDKHIVPLYDQMEELMNDLAEECNRYGGPNNVPEATMRKITGKITRIGDKLRNINDWMSNPDTMGRSDRSLGRSMLDRHGNGRRDVEGTDDQNSYFDYGATQGKATTQDRQQWKKGADGERIRQFEFGGKNLHDIENNVGSKKYYSGKVITLNYNETLDLVDSMEAAGFKSYDDRIDRIEERLRTLRREIEQIQIKTELRDTWETWHAAHPNASYEDFQRQMGTASSMIQRAHTRSAGLNWLADDTDAAMADIEAADRARSRAEAVRNSSRPDRERTRTTLDRKGDSDATKTATNNLLIQNLTMIQEMLVNQVRILRGVTEPIIHGLQEVLQTAMTESRAQRTAKNQQKDIRNDHRRHNSADVKRAIKWAKGQPWYREGDDADTNKIMRAWIQAGSPTPGRQQDNDDANEQNP